MIHGTSVELLGHPHVVRAAAGLDVDDGDLRLRGSQTRGERRVGVAEHADAVRTVFGEEPTEALEDRSGLKNRISRSNPEIHVRLRDLELAQETAEHVVVVVLPGIDDREIDRRMRLQQGEDERRTDHLRTGSEYVDDVQHAHRGGRPRKSIVLPTRLCGAP